VVELVLLKIPVGDIDRAAAFDTEALNLEAAFLAPGQGWATLTGSSLDFHLAHHDIAGLCTRIESRFPESGASWKPPMKSDGAFR